MYADCRPFETFRVLTIQPFNVHLGQPDLTNAACRAADVLHSAKSSLLLRWHSVKQVRTRWLACMLMQSSKETDAVCTTQSLGRLESLFPRLQLLRNASFASPFRPSWSLLVQERSESCKMKSPDSRSRNDLQANKNLLKRAICRSNKR